MFIEGENADATLTFGPHDGIQRAGLSCIEISEELMVFSSNPIGSERDRRTFPLAPHSPFSLAPLFRPPSTFFFGPSKDQYQRQKSVGLFMTYGTSVKICL